MTYQHGIKEKKKVFYNNTPIATSHTVQDLWWPHSSSGKLSWHPATAPLPLVTNRHCQTYYKPMATVQYNR